MASVVGRLVVFTVTEVCKAVWRRQVKLTPAEQCGERPPAHWWCYHFAEIPVLPEFQGAEALALLEQVPAP